MCRWTEKPDHFPHRNRAVKVSHLQRNKVSKANQSIISRFICSLILVIIFLFFSPLISIYILDDLPVSVIQSIIIHVVKDPMELAKYNGIVVKKLKTEEEVVFICDDALFVSLSISDSLCNRTFGISIVSLNSFSQKCYHFASESESHLVCCYKPKEAI
jgi:hypothetical protein